jgi:hypothetical protein
VWKWWRWLGGTAAPTTVAAVTVVVFVELIPEWWKTMVKTSTSWSAPSILLSHIPYTILSAEVMIFITAKSNPSSAA